MNFINNFSKDKIYLIEDKKGYRIKYNFVDKLSFLIPEVFSHFGIEKYNKKDILNLEITNNNNLNNNIIVLLKEIDNYFKNLVINNPKFKELNYTSPLKIIDDNKIQIRTHISTKLKIIPKNNDAATIIIKKNKFKIELEFSSIWEYNNNYGLLLTINLIDFN